ncbi:MAG: 5-oxoprolinase subunit C family protein [Aeromicrobium sp.]
MLKVIKGGVESVVEDWPGRMGYLGNGMASSGAFDPVALGLGNVCVGNAPGEAGIEMAGGYFEGRFEDDAVIAVTGTDMQTTVNGEPIPMYEAVKVNKGDEIKFTHFGDVGFRAYLTVAGGIDVPVYLGSKSTCIFGSYGGFDGRKLEPGDEIKIGTPSASLDSLAGRKIKEDKRPKMEREWNLRAIPGPQASPDYVTEEGMDYLFGKATKVSLTSNRSAVRLDEIPADLGGGATMREIPQVFFARTDGGVGGSHPSNILDNAYAIRGTMNVCGNTPILLIADGPTLGGYMNPLQVIHADLWKIGQGTPGRDYFKFVYCTPEEAVEARKEMKAWLSEESLA